MRTLSATLSAAQKTLTYEPLVKVVLTKASATTYAYAYNFETQRIEQGSHQEQPYSQVLNLSLANGDNALSSIDLKGYQAVMAYGIKTDVARSIWVAGSTYAVDDVVQPTTANNYQYICTVAGTVHASTEPTWPTDLGVTIADSAVTWELDGKVGDEYSKMAPLTVLAQEGLSIRGKLNQKIQAVGIPDLMAEEEGTEDYTPASTNTDTVKTIFTAVAGATLSCFSRYTARTVVYDSEDSLIDSYQPKDAFRVSKGESRLAVLRKLLKMVGCVMRIGNDGKIHVLVPTTTGTTYDSEYTLVSGDHNFFAKTYRRRLVRPGYIQVDSRSTDEAQHTGNASDTDTPAALRGGKFVELRLASNAQATSIATAMLLHEQLNASGGAGFVPMNVGTEVYDYVNMIDAREGGNSRAGNIGGLLRTFGAREFKMEFHFGGIEFGGILGQLGGVEQQNRITTSWLKQSEIEFIYDTLIKMTNLLIKLEARNKVADWEVTRELIIPQRIA